MRRLQAFRETGLATHGPHGIGSANNGTPRMHTTRHAPPPETFMSGAITPRTSTPLSMSICSIQVRWPLSWPRSRSETQVRRDVNDGASLSALHTVSASRCARPACPRRNLIRATVLLQTPPASVDRSPHRPAQPSASRHASWVAAMAMAARHSKRRRSVEQTPAAREVRALLEQV